MNAQDILKYGHSTVVRTIESFPADQVYTTGACGYWSVKDLVAHLGSFELLLEEILSNLLHQRLTPMLDLYTNPQADFNDGQVNLRSGMTMEQVWDEYRQAYERVMAIAAQFSAETWNREGILPWYGADYDLEDFIVYTYYGHKREHCGQIAVFSDRFKPAS
jgi:hypothetical protein